MIYGMYRWLLILIPLLFSLSGRADSAPSLFVLDCPTDAYWRFADEELHGQRLGANDFTTGRGLRMSDVPFHERSYEYCLTPSFLPRVESMGPNDRILDSGAGSAVAMRTLLRSRGKGRRPGLVALGVKKPDDPGLEADLMDLPELEYREGLLKDIPKKGMGKFNTILDVIGPGTYDRDLRADVQTYMEMMPVGGRLYMSIVIDYQVPEGHEMRTEDRLVIHSASKGRITPETWFGMGKGMKVVESERGLATPASGNGTGRKMTVLKITIEKTAETTEPAPLDSTKFVPQEKTTPLREFSTP